MDSRPIHNYKINLNVNIPNEAKAKGFTKITCILFKDGIKDDWSQEISEGHHMIDCSAGHGSFGGATPWKDVKLNLCCKGSWSKRPRAEPYDICINKVLKTKCNR